MFFLSRGEWIADVTVPISLPRTRTGHFVMLKSIRGPSISMPTSLRRGPASLIFCNAALPMNSDGFSRSTVQPVGRARRPNMVRFASLDHRVPEVLPSGAVAEVQLVPDLAGPPRACHEQRDAVELRRGEEIVRKVRDLLAEQVFHQGFRLRPLDLERGGI